MTTQNPDTCVFDGRRWAIEQWDGNYSSIPTNEKLGIETTSSSTANWSGRIDHFTVHRNKLFLLKIEVNLAKGFNDVLPDGAHREVVHRYENMLYVDKDGEREIVKEYRFEYFVFHHLFVRYTGDLHLSYPCIDLWEQPDTNDEGDRDIYRTMRLTFRCGELIGESR